MKTTEKNGNRSGDRYREDDWNTRQRISTKIVRLARGVKIIPPSSDALIHPPTYGRWGYSRRTNR
ncbi:hypothetical protein [Shimazuella alba]|uniref:Uncharacterized protein n=1 Tax=Shimazuella alba TaxID=2690964 RepID=A0A6I4VQ26_9BACL|nr:hypothetical protein [Shimazuella alba]MXQ53747.1 hypothetical protein [Shimazuella alba]